MAASTPEQKKKASKTNKQSKKQNDSQENSDLKQSLCEMNNVPKLRVKYLKMKTDFPSFEVLFHANRTR